MQRAELIKIEDISQMINAIFSIGNVNVYESYSDMEKDLKQFSSAIELKDYIQEAVKYDKSLLNFALYYIESKGFYEIVKIALNSKYCEGKMWRYRVDGWGLIYFHIDLRKSGSEIECRFTVNTEKRAKNWESTCPALRSPNLWDWKVVESKARKLNYELKKIRTTKSWS